MRLTRRAFTLVELMVVIAIIGLLASVLATSVVSKMRQASHDLDKKVLQDIYNNLGMVSHGTDKRVKRLFVMGPMAELKGREFWEGCFRHKVFKEDMLPKMVATSGNDVEMDRRSLDNLDAFFLEPMSCSWTAPQGNESFYLMSARGENRRIVICANERNWINHEDEVLSVWSDGEVAEYVRHDDMLGWGYEISLEQWNAPGTELFGKVKPFDGVFD
ncbi:MAG: type II secretion system protein [Planctomycetes bacterium]|nr:type II secretion system protein [Planctomycetota bacterium]MCC7510663.1 type II secretion system protein [Planctomycetota bacterium]